MNTALVGYTGFVGSNIYASGSFDAVYNSQNIEMAYGTNPELLIYAGLRAEKYLANQMPEKDKELIVQAEDNIAKIHPEKVVLISTIDVFRIPEDVDEESEIDTQDLHAYGYHRYLLELWVRKNYPNSLIVRLPGLFGNNIKKNFIYDYINLIPSMLRKEKFAELSEKEPELEKHYTYQNNGFYKRNNCKKNNEFLQQIFESLGFSALNFTDSRSVFQFYNLERLWGDILIALNNKIKLLHLATEPISVSELYQYLEGKDFINEISEVPIRYNYKTIYSEMFGGSKGYILGKEDVKKDIERFVKNEKQTRY